MIKIDENIIGIWVISSKTVYANCLVTLKKKSGKIIFCSRVFENSKKIEYPEMEMPSSIDDAIKEARFLVKSYCEPVGFDSCELLMQNEHVESFRKELLKNPVFKFFDSDGKAEYIIEAFEVFDDHKDAETTIFFRVLNCLTIAGYMPNKKCQLTLLNNDAESSKILLRIGYDYNNLKEIIGKKLKLVEAHGMLKFYKLTEKTQEETR